MSRAYRVRVRESVRHTVRAEDHVSTTLELLEILPREEMAELLRASTQMSVIEAADDTELKPNCVYIGPPGHDGMRFS